MLAAAPDRVAIYGIENHAGTPVYVHAKTCIIDDTWATIGSDNFNRRSWTHDSELSAAIIDLAEDATYARDLRLALAAEHLDRRLTPSTTASTHTACSPPSPTPPPSSTDGTLTDVSARVPQAGCGASEPPRISPLKRALAAIPYRVVHDPDGRPRSIRGTDRF